VWRSKWLSLAIVMLVAACSTAPLGAMEDLNSQIDDLNVPPSMVELDQTYVKDCPSTCPLLVRWYDVSAPVETIRPELLSRFESAGISVNQASASPGLFSARSERYIFFIVLDSEMISGNANAPPGADAEISVHLLSDS
jgi:hypothetical protein